MIETIVTIIKYAIPALILLGCCVFVHEFGHMIGAKLVGIKTKVFSLGFGKPFFKKTVGDTTYQIAAIPFGGYCSFYGDNPDEAREGKDYEYLTASPWRRLVAVIMGPLFNLFFGIVLFFIMNVTGYTTETTKIIIAIFSLLIFSGEIIEYNLKTILIKVIAFITFILLCKQKKK